MTMMGRRRTWCTDMDHGALRAGEKEEIREEVEEQQAEPDIEPEEKQAEPA